ncbi:hypothetical protein IWW40_000166 [Coemansia sp. RSA 1250]|nr:hypothetical protein IWW40_000166 [Coemansia sp. RSA 1250]
MSRGRGRGRGRGGPRREMTGLQSEFIHGQLFNEKQPPKQYPEYDILPVREATKEERHIIDLMNQFQAEMKASVFYLQQPAVPHDIIRYSDRYITEAKTASLKNIKTDLQLFPEELHSVVSSKKIRRTKATEESSEDVLKMLDRAQQKEGEKDEEDKSDQEEELLEEEEDDEEEGNDYLDTYFDNGEDDDIGDIDDDEGGGDYY